MRALIGPPAPRPATAADPDGVPRDVMKLLYFAWLRARIGHAEENFAAARRGVDVAGLLDWLRNRGPRYAEALRDLSVVRVAVNQDYVGRDHPIREGDEVADLSAGHGG